MEYGWAVSRTWPPLDQGDLYWDTTFGVSTLVPPQDLCELYYYSPVEDKRIYGDEC